MSSEIQKSQDSVDDQKQNDKKAGGSKVERNDGDDYGNILRKNIQAKDTKEQIEHDSDQKGRKDDQQEDRGNDQVKGEKQVQQQGNQMIKKEKDSQTEALPNHPSTLDNSDENNNQIHQFNSNTIPQTPQLDNNNPSIISNNQMNLQIHQLNNNPNLLQTFMSVSEKKICFNYFDLKLQQDVQYNFPSPQDQSYQDSEDFY